MKYNIQNYTSQKSYTLKIILGLTGTDFTRFLVKDQLELEQIYSSLLPPTQGGLRSPCNMP